MPLSSPEQGSCGLVSVSSVYRADTRGVLRINFYPSEMGFRAHFFHGMVLGRRKPALPRGSPGEGERASEHQEVPAVGRGE